MAPEIRKLIYTTNLIERKSGRLAADSYLLIHLI